MTVLLYDNLIFRRHRWKRFYLLESMLLFRCLSVTFVHCAQLLKWQKISTRFLLRTTAPYVHRSC